MTLAELAGNGRLVKIRELWEEGKHWKYDCNSITDEAFAKLQKMVVLYRNHMKENGREPVRLRITGCGIPQIISVIKNFLEATGSL